MSDSPSLDKLKKKIQDAQEKQPRPKKKPAKPSREVNRYFNLGVELVSGVFVGVGVGLLFDWMFGTSPWGLISLFILGSGAGMLNVYRALMLEHKQKEKKEKDG